MHASRPRGCVQSIGIVGDGRLAVTSCTTSVCSTGPLSDGPGSAVRSPVETLAPCETVVLLIRDGAIAPFVERWPALREKRLVHCSGSVVTTLATAAHPLMTFARDLYDLETYRRIPFILDEDAAPFDQLLPGLPNASFRIPARERPYYHALCVMAGNFSTLLWRKLFHELHDRYGIPASAAYPYLAQTAANLSANSGDALTGPLCRNDVVTIEANVRALAGDPFGSVYAAFVDAFNSEVSR